MRPYRWRANSKRLCGPKRSRHQRNSCVWSSYIVAWTNPCARWPAPLRPCMSPLQTNRWRSACVPVVHGSKLCCGRCSPCPPWIPCPSVLCHEGLPIRQKGLPFGLKKPKNGTWHGYWECSTGLGERSTPYYTYTIVRPVVSQNRHFARKVCRDCQKALPRGPRYRGFSRPNMSEERLRFHGKAFWQNVRPTAKLSGNAPTPCHTTSKAENSGETLYDTDFRYDLEFLVLIG